MEYVDGQILKIIKEVIFVNNSTNVLIDSAFPAAILSGITLIFEPKGRQAEIALFCLNKSLETSYNMALRRKYPVKIPHGECLLMGVSMAILTYHYINNK